MNFSFRFTKKNKKNESFYCILLNKFLGKRFRTFRLIAFFCQGCCVCAVKGIASNNFLSKRPSCFCTPKWPRVCVCARCDGDVILTRSMIRADVRVPVHETGSKNFLVVWQVEQRNASNRADHTHIQHAIYFDNERARVQTCHRHKSKSQ